MLHRKKVYDPSMYVEDVLNLWEEDKLVVPRSCSEQFQAAVNQLINKKVQIRDRLNQQLSNLDPQAGPNVVKRLEIDSALADARITECQRLLDVMPVVDDVDLRHPQND